MKEFTPVLSIKFPCVEKAAIPISCSESMKPKEYTLLEPIHLKKKRKKERFNRI